MFKASKVHRGPANHTSNHEGKEDLDPCSLSFDSAGW